MSGSFQLSGPYQSEPEYRASVKSGHSSVKLGWFQRWFLKHSQQAWEYSKNHIDGSQYDGGRRGPVGPSIRAQINTRNSIDMSLIKADGGWIVQFQSYDDHHDRTNVYHYVIPDSEEFGQKLAEIVTLQCLR